MKIVALVSGGKDSCFSMMECVRHGHEIVALANLHPADCVTELDSFMFQSVGSNLVHSLADCMGVPLVTRCITGASKAQHLNYAPTEGDEVEDMLELLREVKTRFPDVEGVCTGAVFSNYQRVRVENVCRRLNLTSFAYLWREEQAALLDRMIEKEVDAVVVKVASMGLVPKKHLGKSIQELYPLFHSLNEKYQFHVCGEGGEYETLTLNCPLFKKRIVIDEFQIVIHSDDMFAPVGYLNILKHHVEPKEGYSERTDQQDSIFHFQSTATPQSSDTESSSVAQCAGVVDTESMELEMVSSNHSEKPSTLAKCRNQVHFSALSSSLSDGSLDEEMHDILGQISASLVKEGMSFSDIVYVHLYLKDMKNFGQVNAVYCQYFGELPASRSCVEVPLQRENILVDCLCIKGSGVSKYDKIESREVLHVQSISSWAPTCIGPYSQANRLHSSMILLAGQIAFIPETMKLVEDGLASETAQSLKNVGAVLEALESNVRHVVHGVIYLKAQPSQDGEWIKSNQNYCRELLVDNAGWKDKYEFEEDSDESDEEEDKSEMARVLVRNAPLLSVTVSHLPRDATIEAEMIAVTHKAKKFLLPKSHPAVEGVSTSGKWHTRSHMAAIDRIFCLAQCSINFEHDVEEKEYGEISSEIVNQIQYCLDETSNPWQHVLHLRVYFIQDAVKESALRNALQEAFEVISDLKHKFLPATSFVPVYDMYPNAKITVQVSAHDYEKAETELWLRNLI